MRAHTLLIFVGNWDAKLYFVCVGWRMEMCINHMPLSMSILLIIEKSNFENKKPRLNKSLADTNGALVLGGASYPILTGRLPIQTGLLSYIVVPSAANIRTIPETCKSFCLFFRFLPEKIVID